MNKQAIWSLANETTSGVLAGVIASTITYPLDLVKTRLQADLTSNKQSIISLLADIVKQQGAAGLFVGITSEYVKVLVQNSIYFSSYSLFKNAMVPNHPRAASALDLFIVGILAGAATQLFVNPISVVQTRQQTRLKADSDDGFLLTLNSLIVTEGPGILYKGLIPALVLTVNPALQFMVFDKLKSYWLRRKRVNPNALQNPEDLTHLESFIIGAIAKAIATIATYPYIMAKTRMQSSSQGGGVLTLLLHIVRKNGVLAAYKGMQTQIVKSVLSTALMFMFKDSIQRHVKKGLSKLITTEV